MNYHSTRSLDQIKGSQAIVNGLADDGGLYIFNEIPKYEIDYKQAYKVILNKVLEAYFPQFKNTGLILLINRAYSEFDTPNITEIKDFKTFGFLELFHGPTLAFKDMALSIFPYLLSESMMMEEYDGKLLIVSATSGDTGSAAMYGIKDVPNIEICVMYPKDGVSEIQALQMKRIEASNVEAIGIDGDFDTAQSIVKELFSDEDFINKLEGKNYRLSSANSINIARLIPQIAYYIDAYVKLVNSNIIKENDLIDIVVPTGNFGNILAGYIAKEMGVPIDKITGVCNENDVLYQFFKTGLYDSRRNLVKTNTPSMDILISSNLERYLYLIFKDTDLIKSWMNDLSSKGYFQLNEDQLNKINVSINFESVNDTQVKSYIKDMYDKYEYLLDPHSASCLVALNESSNYQLMVSTASVFKFIDTIEDALSLDKEDIVTFSKTFNLEIPQSLEVLLNKEDINIKEMSSKDVKTYLLKERGL